MLVMPVAAPRKQHRPGSENQSPPHQTPEGACWSCPSAKGAAPSQPWPSAKETRPTKQSGPTARLIGLSFTRCRWVRLAPNMGNSERPVAGFFPIAPRGRVAVHPRAGALPETFTRCGRNAAKKTDMNRADGA